MQNQYDPYGARKNCLYCGTELFEGSKFCARCGKPVDHNYSVQADQPLLKSTPVSKPKNKSKYTTIGSLKPVCPYCDYQFDEMPKRKRKCPNCKNTIYYRKRPYDDNHVLLTEDQLAILETDLKNRRILSLIEREISTSRQQIAFNNVKSDLTKKFGKTPSDSDIFWGFLNTEAQYYASKKDWGLYRNTISSQANLLQIEGKDRQAFRFYLWIFYLDLNGPENSSGSVTRPPFNPEMGFIAPSFIDQIIKLRKSLGLSPDEFKTIFLEHNSKIYNSLKLPISPINAWNIIEREIKRQELL